MEADADIDANEGVVVEELPNEDSLYLEVVSVR
jgi:hypothetical protein